MTLSNHTSFPRIVGLAVAAFACASAGCSGEPLEEKRSRALPVSTDCQACHAPHIPGGPLHAVELSFVLEQPLDWEPAKLGYAVLGDDDACTGSCHRAHAEDTLARTQWAIGPHGERGDPKPAWSSTTMSPVCIRCHNGAGFATYADVSNASYPAWVLPPTTVKTAWFPTCDSCHDKTGYPTADDPRLRFKSSKVALVSGSPAPGTVVVDATLDVGAQSATCMLCHQYRESGTTLYANILGKGGDLNNAASIDVPITTSAVTPHYAGVGAMLFSIKAYEVAGKRYSPGNTFHQDLGCVGCHMYKSDDPARGGHTVAPAGCQRCHGVDFTHDDFPRVGRLQDVDGDGQASPPQAELAGLQKQIIDVFTSNGMYFNVNVRPYFFDTNDPALQNSTSGHAITSFTPRQLAVIFNLFFVMKDPAAFVHNYRYAAQILRDSYELLTGTSLAGVRPATADDRPARTYGSP